MREGNQREKFLVKGGKAYIGIDVHKNSCHITARVEEEVFYMRIPSD